MIQFLTFVALFSCIYSFPANSQAILDRTLYAEDFDSGKAVNDITGLVVLHIFSFAKCNPILRPEVRSECFNERLQSSGEIKVDFEAIVIDGWYFSDLTNKHTPGAPPRKESNVPALSSSRLLYLKLLKTKPPHEAYYLNTLKVILASPKMDFIFEHMLEMRDLPNGITAHVVYDRYSLRFFTVLDKLRKHFIGEPFKHKRMQARGEATSNKGLMKRRGTISSIQEVIPTRKRKASSMSPMMHRTVHEVHDFEPLGVDTAEDDTVLLEYAHRFCGTGFDETYLSGTSFKSNP